MAGDAGIYQHYTPPGALVCDPFIGSGVTAIESLVLGRRAVATDINPVARFITRMTAIAPIDLDGLQAAYEQVRDSVGQLIVSLDVMPEPEILALLHSLDYPRDSIPFKVRRSGAITIDQMHTPRQLAGLTLLRDAIVRVDDPVLRDLLKVAFANTVRYTNRTYIGRGQNEKGSPYRGNAGFAPL
jgi:adenine-specific DNA methylase